MVFLEIANFLLDLVATGGYLAIFVAMVVEGVLTPIPSAAILPFAGLLAREGTFSLPLVILVATSGATVGSLGAYAIGRFLGRPFLVRYGRFFRFEEKSLELVDGWFQRWGSWAVFLANSFTGFRSIISFPAGITRMDLRLFIPFTFLGALVWSTILVTAGFVLGQAAFAFAEGLENFDLLVLAALGAVVVGYVAYRWWRRHRRVVGEPQAP
ncbi:MAG: DedA family protein [Thermoplasmata archaeon]|nr:DedA family protein [Thermoplasmata archaeon]